MLEALRTGYACSEVWAREKHRIRYAQTGGAWGLFTRAEYVDMQDKQVREIGYLSALGGDA